MGESYHPSLCLIIKFLSDLCGLGILFAHVILVAEEPVGAECS